MSQERNDEPFGQHRLFHAMVLMGGSLALACGGVSSGTGDDESGGSGATSGTGGVGAGAGTGGASSGNGGASGAGAGTGGASSGNGGASGSGGSLLMPTAGTASVEPNPTSCPPSQWSCAEVSQYCYRDGYTLPESNCVCDDLRPVAPSDCPAGTVFACHAASIGEDGSPLPQVVPFSCACVTDQNNCDIECSEVAPRSGTCTDVHARDVRSVLCNCAVIVLR